MGGEEMERVSFRYDPEKKRRLEGDHLNLSSLMRDLADSYIRAGDTEMVGLQRRLKDTESELDDLRMEKARIENKIDATERELEELQEKIMQRRESTPEEVVEFAEKVKSGSVSPDQLDPGNPAVETWASKAGLPPSRFIAEVERRL